MEKSENSSGSQTRGDLLRDPLVEVTRRARKTLLGVSTAGIVIGKVGLIPTRISTLGITFSPTEITNLHFVLALIVVYFIFEFVIYGASDLVAWVGGYQNWVTKRRAEHIKEREKEEEEAKRTLHTTLPRSYVREGQYLGRSFAFALTLPVAYVRALFDFIVPVLIGIYAAIILLNASPTTKSFLHNSIGLGNIYAGVWLISWIIISIGVFALTAKVFRWIDTHVLDPLYENKKYRVFAIGSYLLILSAYLLIGVYLTDFVLYPVFFFFIETP